jgi:hypothetical protein
MKEGVTMRVGLQGWGSEGDVRPLIALAARLRQSGHDARLVLTPVDGKHYVPLCESLGLGVKLVPEKMAVTVQELVREAKSADPTKLMTAVLRRGRRASRKSALATGCRSGRRPRRRSARSSAAS